MKRAVVLMLFCLIAVCICGKAGHARPDYHKQFEAMYKESKIAAAAEKAKCTVCHYGKSKKDRNDYGTALSKSLTKEQFDSLKEKKDELNKKVAEALKAVVKEKSKSGKTFGELIDAGQLPGTAPEGN